MGLNIVLNRKISLVLLSFHNFTADQILHLGSGASFCYRGPCKYFSPVHIFQHLAYSHPPLKNSGSAPDVVDEHENSPLRVENGKRQTANGRREKWRENRDHVVILPFTLGFCTLS